MHRTPIVPSHQVLPLAGPFEPPEVHPQAWKLVPTRCTPACPLSPSLSPHIISLAQQLVPSHCTPQFFPSRCTLYLVLSHCTPQRVPSHYTPHPFKQRAQCQPQISCTPPLSGGWDGFFHASSCVGCEKQSDDSRQASATPGDKTPAYWAGHCKPRPPDMDDQKKGKRAHHPVAKVVFWIRAIQKTLLNM